MSLLLGQPSEPNPTLNSTLTPSEPKPRIIPAIPLNPVILPTNPLESPTDTCPKCDVCSCTSAHIGYGIGLGVMLIVIIILIILLIKKK